MTKTRRQAALAELLDQGAITSQAEAVRQLAALNIKVTQATVSRDLDELGALRHKTKAGARYELRGEASAFGVSLPRVLRDLVFDRSAAGPLAVLRTPPGHASVVAAALDRAHIDGVLGTVAGDDTLFVCGDERTQGKGVLRKLEQLETTM